MDALEEVAGAPIDHSHIILKGKRTKRSRPHSPISFTMISTPPPPPPPHSSAGDARVDNIPTAVPAFPAPTAEDEDMARCLMLLSRGEVRGERDVRRVYATRSPPYTAEDGGAWNNNNNNTTTSKFCSKRYVETTFGGGGDAAGVKVGMYVYECKTCGRTFPTFQALGGHRTSHTKEKPPLTIEAAGKRPFSLYEDDDVNPSPASNNNYNKIPKMSPNRHYHSSSSTVHFYDYPAKYSPRIHECSYCGAEFASGQALGGHMRRHRGGAAQLSPASSTFLQSNRDNNNNNNNGKGLNLELDLNLPPAGEDNNNNQDQRRRRRGYEQLPENQEQQLPAPGQLGPTLFLSTTPPLVGCKYI